MIADMAADFHAINSSMLGEITASEFTGLAWSKSKKHERSPHILEMISFFNDTNHFVQFMLLVPTSQPKDSPKDTMLKERTRMLEFFINLQAECLKQGDFNTAMAINSALSSSGVSRIKDTWKNVHEDVMETFRNSSEIFETDKNFSNLKAAIRPYLTGENQGSYIPYLGTTLSEATFIDEGNPSAKSDAEPDQRNYMRLQMMAGAYRAISTPFSRVEGRQPKFDLLSDVKSVFTAAPTILREAEDEEGGYLHQIAERIEPACKADKAVEEFQASEKLQLVENALKTFIVDVSTLEDRKAKEGARDAILEKVDQGLLDNCDTIREEAEKALGILQSLSEKVGVASQMGELRSLIEKVEALTDGLTTLAQEQDTEQALTGALQSVTESAEELLQALGSDRSVPVFQSKLAKGIWEDLCYRETLNYQKRQQAAANT